MFSTNPRLFKLSCLVCCAVTATLPTQVIAAIDSESSAAPVLKRQFLAQVNLPPELPPGSVPAEPLPPADIDPDSRRDEVFIDPQPLPQLPPVDELLDEPAETNTLGGLTSGPDETFEVSGIQLEGSTVFSTEDFSTLFEQYIGRPITFDDLLQIRSTVTQRYIDAGFLTSGAFIPPQTLEEGMVTVQVIEGMIEDIEIVGTRRLNPDYVRSRLGLAAQPPINADKLLEGLQRLQIDPLIETVSADLQAGVQPGTSILRVDITEAESFGLSVELDNGRSPNIGSFRRRIDLLEGNVFGIGDRATLAYSNTNGSNSIDASYSVPVSPHNTRITLKGGISESRVIDDTFEALDISSDAFYYDIGVTHPLIETPTQELSLGFTLSRKENQTRLGIDNIGPFPLSPGADEDGETRVSALRFSQNWAKRSQRQVLAARSQFNVGGSWLNGTNNDDGSPDSQFFSWRGQGQWVRLLGEDALFFLRSDLQLAADSLLLTEQFGLGGQQTVRGYRQDILLRDNGGLLSAEARLPIARFSENSALQVTPFIDAGAAWNHSDNPEGNNVLVGTGVGLLWQRDDNFSARLDWGLPLVNVDSTSDSLQDSGIYFSLQYDLF